MTQSISSRFVVLVATIAFAVSSLAGGASIPARIENRGYTIWTSVEGGVVTDAILDRVPSSALLNAPRRNPRDVKTNATSSDPCTIFMTPPVVEHYEANTTSDELVRNSREIFVGTIVGTTEGLYRGLPSLLLQIRTTESYGTAPREIGREILVPYPYATLTRNGEVFCTRPENGFKPAAGDRVILFSYLPSASETVEFYAVDPVREIAFGRNGRYFGPRSIAGDVRADTGNVFDSSVDRLRGAVRAAAKDKVPAGGVADAQ